MNFYEQKQATMKKPTVKKSTKKTTKPFTLKVWRAESHRKGVSCFESERPAFYIFTNKPSVVAIADFERLLGNVPRFQRLHKAPMIECERAIRELRLADACREMHKRKLLSGI